jgi:hypothetical protein
LPILDAVRKIMIYELATIKNLEPKKGFKEQKLQVP